MDDSAPRSQLPVDPHLRTSGDPEHGDGGASEAPRSPKVKNPMALITPVMSAATGVFTRLPSELVLMVLNCLGTEDLQKVAATCRYFALATQDPQFQRHSLNVAASRGGTNIAPRAWQGKRFRHVGISLTKVEEALDALKQLSVLRKDDLTSFSLSLVPSLVSNMRICLLVLEFIYKTFIVGSRIRTLSLDLEISSDPSFADKEAWYEVRIVSALSSLRRLKLYQPNNRVMEVISPALRSLGLYATRNHLKEEMSNLKRLTQLRHLLLQANPFPNNAVHEMICTSGFASLVSVELFSASIELERVVRDLHTCQRLRDLSINNLGAPLVKEITRNLAFTVPTLELLSLRLEGGWFRLRVQCPALHKAKLCFPTKSLLLDAPHLIHLENQGFAYHLYHIGKAYWDCCPEEVTIHCPKLCGFDMHNWLSNRDMRQLRKLSLVVQSLSGRLNLTEAPLEELRIEPVSQLSQLILAHSIDVNEFLGSHPHFDRLAYLNLYNIPSLCDGDLARLAQGCLTSLRRLVLGGNKAVSDKGLGAILPACSALQSLNLSDCPTITDASVILALSTLPSLRLLSVSGLPISDAAFRSKEERRRLMLAQINASECKQLTDATLQVFAKCCPDLERLAMSRCSLTPTAVTQLVAACPRLRCLSLWHAVKLSPLDRTALMERLRARADALGGVASLRT